jgi:HTH-type transcriptional regulator / antitoxin HipB
MGREVIGGESMRRNRVKCLSGAAPVPYCVRLPCPVQAVLVVVHGLPSVDSQQTTDQSSGIAAWLAERATGNGRLARRTARRRAHFGWRRRPWQRCAAVRPTAPRPPTCNERSARSARAEYREGYEEARRAFLIGQVVRERRLALGLSQTEVAARAGMTQPALSRLEAGGVVPTIPVLERIALALDTELVVTFAAPAA